MKKFVLAASFAALSAAFLPVTASAQNVAIVNGKPVPKARVELLVGQVTKNGQPRSPELEAQVRDEVVLREIFMQEAEKRGIPASADYRAQMELARQSIMIRELFADYAKKNPVTDAEAQAEYDKFKAQNSGTEYRARHILVEKEDEAKALIKQLNGGAKFEDLAAKNSKDPGSAANGGDLDFANPGNFVPEFSKAMTSLKKGEITQEPVKSQFGFHIIKLEDTREAQFPAFDDVKPQIMQRLSQQKLANFQQELRSKAKTDHKFAN
ncbi:peptidylprolyl isomerase [Kinneretia asaccharophila]|uniref:peptidylprolyl isomerase n=1 Tax=Roseateles asaccharophilus TaxID=582607 RepID=A0A4R6NBT3_9BURK|nr:peptidylprolyl isomerase [Roseateles asaccharophilus]MDN3546149.1 peptidylprolyl isomerase [Roseateles asaccharophilus]TDP11120.1 peptidyl-prolyl cis-trans isomerase C [Roseateles asaccharophilus]